MIVYQDVFCVYNLYMCVLMYNCNMYMFICSYACVLICVQASIHVYFGVYLGFLACMLTFMFVYMHFLYMHVSGVSE